MMLHMSFPITGEGESAVGIVGLGLFIGFLGGMFGVGGGFLMTPLLNVALSIPYPIAIGSSLAQMTGLSISASVVHHRHNHINFRLAFVLLLGSVFGVKAGSACVEILKRAATITVLGRTIQAGDLYIPIAYIIILFSIGVSMFRESIRALGGTSGHVEANTAIADKIRALRIPPYVRPNKDADCTISIWIVVATGFLVGALSGFMGVGGGFLLTPIQIYLLGVPTLVAIGTGLFFIIFVSLEGTFFHARAGNVDIVLVLLLLVGSAVGAQVGAMVSKKIKVQRIRYFFSIIVFGAATMISVKLILKFI